jgi:PAS domain S-box-containing protein
MTQNQLNNQLKNNTNNPNYLSEEQINDFFSNNQIVLQQLIDHLPDKIYFKDSHGVKTMCNKADWMAAGGKTIDDVLGKTDFDTYESDLAEKFTFDDNKIFKSGKPLLNREEPGYDVNRHVIWVSSSKIPFVDENGKNFGLFGIGRDITRLKKAEQKLEKLSWATAKIIKQIGKSSFEKVLTLIAKLATELLEAEECGISIVIQEGFLTPIASFGYGDDVLPKGFTIPIVSGVGTGLSGYIAASGKLFNKHGKELINHFAVKQTKISRNHKRECHSLLAIPLILGTGKNKKIIGLLRVENKKKNNLSSPDFFFDDADESLIRIFANTIVMTIRSTQLIQQIKHSRTVAQKIAEVSTIEKLQPALKKIVRGVQESTDCDICTIYSYDPVSSIFLQSSCVGCDAENMTTPESISDESTLRKIITNPKLIYVAIDVTKDDIFNGKFAKQEKVHSALAIKLLYFNKPMGVLFVNYKKEHIFSKDEIALIKQFGHHAAVTIRNTQLYQESTRLFKLLQTINLNLVSQCSIEEILKLIVQHAVNLSGVVHKTAFFGYISLVEGERLQFSVAWPHKNLSKFNSIKDINLTGTEKIGITGKAVKSGTTINAGCVNDKLLYPEYIPIDKRVQSELAIPIKCEGKIIGVINLEHYLPNAFDAYDIYAQEKLAEEVAIAVQTAKHFEQIRHDEFLQKSLLITGNAILQTQETDQLLQILVERLKEILSADIVTLYTTNHESEIKPLNFHFAGTLQNNNTKKEIRRIKDNSIVREIIHNQAAIFVNDTENDNSKNISSFTNTEKIRSFCGIPLLNGEKCVGVLFINYRSPYIFSTPQREDLKLFATQVAFAIKNTIQYEEIIQKKYLVGSRTALAFMGMANSVWGHSIKGNLINIRNSVTLIRNKFPLNQNNHTTLELNRLSNRLNTIESQAISAIDKEMIPILNEENVKIFKVNSFLTERINQLSQSDHFRKVTFSTDLKEDYSIKIAPEWFRCVIDVLLNNGLYAMKKSPKKIFQISTSKRNSFVEILVTDYGCGIPKEIRELILRDPIPHHGSSEGFGLGLLMAQAILQSVKGDIKLVTTGQNGTTFKIVLPLC